MNKNIYVKLSRGSAKPMINLYQGLTTTLFMSAFLRRVNPSNDPFIQNAKKVREKYVSMPHTGSKQNKTPTI